MLDSIGWRWTLATSVALIGVGLGCWTASAASDDRLEAPVVAVTAGKPTEFAFTLSKASALPALVSFKVTNRGALPHAFAIGGAATRVLGPGQSALLTVSFSKPGSYEYRSTLRGQAARGMRGRIQVVNPPPVPAAKPPATAAAPPPVPAVAAATPSPVPPPALEATPAQAAEPEPPPKVNQCGECHYD